MSWEKTRPPGMTLYVVETICALTLARESYVRVKIIGFLCKVAGIFSTVTIFKTGQKNYSRMQQKTTKLWPIHASVELQFLYSVLITFLSNIPSTLAPSYHNYKMIKTAHITKKWRIRPLEVIFWSSPCLFCHPIYG